MLAFQNNWISITTNLKKGLIKIHNKILIKAFIKLFYHSVLSFTIMINREIEQNFIYT